MDSFRCLMHKSDVVKVCFILVEIKRNTLDLYCSEEYIYICGCGWLVMRVVSSWESRGSVAAAESMIEGNSYGAVPSPAHSHAVGARRGRGGEAAQTDKCFFSLPTPVPDV